MDSKAVLFLVELLRKSFFWHYFGLALDLAEKV